MSKHDDQFETFDPVIYRLMEGLGNAEAALEMLGHDIEIESDRFVPVGTSALRSVREAMAAHPEIREHVDRSSWPTCEGCDEPAESADEDGVGTCNECRGEEP